MNKTAEIIFNLTGQTIDVYPPEWVEGIPSSATCSVFAPTRSNDDTAEFSPTVTISSVAETVSAAAGFSEAQRNKLTTTTNVTGINVGDSYLMANAAGQRERVVVSGVTSATKVVTLRDDLAFDYASTVGTFKGLKMSITIDATFVADEAKLSAPWIFNTVSPAIVDRGVLPYRVVWKYTVNSVIRRYYSYFRLVRQPFTHSVVVRDIEEIWPDVLDHDSRNVRGQQLAPYIEAGVRRFRSDLLARGMYPERIRDSELVDAGVLRATLYVMSMAGLVPTARAGDAVYRDDVRKDYESLLQNAFTVTTKVPQDEGSKGSITTSAKSSLFFNQ